MLAAIREATPDMSALKDLKWMVFKAKQKGKTNYDQKMKEDLSDGRFNFAQNTVSETLQDLSFGYNWPYDYFSLVENVRLSVDVELRKLSQPELLNPGDPGQIEGAPVPPATTPVFTGVVDGAIAGGSAFDIDESPPATPPAEPTTETLPAAGAIILDRI